VVNRREDLAHTTWPATKRVPTYAGISHRLVLRFVVNRRTAIGALPAVHANVLRFLDPVTPVPASAGFVDVGAVRNIEGTNL
jgi:hypothetical protein